MSEPEDRGRAARLLMRRQSHAALATSLDGAPYASLAAVAFDHAAHPLLLLSDLAQHTRNLAGERRVSLLFAAATGDPPDAVGDPLAAPRLSLLGEAARCEDGRLLARFVARHPSAAAYAGFGDFHLYRVTLGRGHLVAGFGRISWIEPAVLRLDADAGALAAAEAEIVSHMNSEHADAVALFAARLLGRRGGGWRMTGIDPEGLDLRRREETGRLDFAEPVLDPAAARQELIAMTARARAAPA
jgi:heme oxygenase (biliverdin-IX-beta and delta-forming)